MPKRSSKKELYIELSIATAVLVISALFFIETDFFEWWFNFTRAHEKWELDEFFSVFVAIMMAGFALSLRHAYIMDKVLTRLEKAKLRLEQHEKEKIRREKMIALGSLASGLAHEINNALQPTIGLGDFIRQSLKDSGNEKHLKYMDTIMSSATHAQKIVENVLLFSHEKSLAFEECNAAEMLYEALEFCSFIIPNGVKVDIDNFSNPDDKTNDFLIRCNKTGMFQIFYNLLKNAATAMDNQGTIKITKSQCQIPYGDYAPALCVKISDTGCGMSKEHISRIFDPFYSTKDASEGTGLGLSNVHTLVQQHNGSIKVDSTVGKGTTFSICLPIITKTKRE